MLCRAMHSFVERTDMYSCAGLCMTVEDYV